MATATQQPRSASGGEPGQVPVTERSPKSLSADASMEFAIFQDNSDAYYWALTDDEGSALARSESFDSYDIARRQVERIRAGAASARMNFGAGGAHDTAAT